MALTLFSANDHFIEPANLFEGRVPAKLADRTPKLGEVDGFLTWSFEGEAKQISALLAHVGLPEGWSEKRVTWNDMRPGCYDAVARLQDMDVDGVFACVLFPTFPGFGGEMFMASSDRDLSLACVRAWNDFVLEEWVAADPGRFVPLQVPFYNEPELGADEIRRNAERGFKAVTFMNPSSRGLPSMYTSHWDPILRACEETETVLCHHTEPHPNWLRAPEASFGMGTTLFQSNAMMVVNEWIWAGIPLRFPKLRVVVNEAGGGWLPHLLERLRYVVGRSGIHRVGWPAPGQDPVELLRYFRFSTQEIHSAVRVGDELGIEDWLLETDYPHPETVWPRSQEDFQRPLSGMSDRFVSDITWRNASRMFRHPVPSSLQLPST